jgi:hypothetical protein
LDILVNIAVQLYCANCFMFKYDVSTLGTVKHGVGFINRTPDRSTFRKARQAGSLAIIYHNHHVFVQGADQNLAHSTDIGLGSEAAEGLAWFDA